jgi:hypothetical protein
MDSEGGDAWMDALGVVTIAGRDWLTETLRATEVQWIIGALDVRVTDARPTRTNEFLVNDATIANTGGLAQNADDAPSKQRYGTRTTRRLDLLGDSDLASQFLADRLVANLKDVRPRVRQATVPILSRNGADFGLGVTFGDLTLTFVNSIHGWGMGFAGHVIGVENIMTDDQWTVKLVLDDAFVSNVDGGFDFEAFSDGFALGGQP